MKLNLLSIEGNKEYEKRNDVVSVRAQSHYLTEQFLHFFHKVDLDGSSKLVICFDEKPKDQEKYGRYEYFHVSLYYVDKEDLDRFQTIKKDALGEYFLGIVVDACSYIARFHGREEVIGQIEQAAEEIRANQFELVILQKNISKVSGDKRFKAKVYRKLDPFGEIWYVDVEDRHTKTVKRHEIMEQYTSISKVDFYKKASWEGHIFILKDRLDRETARIEAV